MMLEEIGMRVKMARITRQMSQAQLAATLDVSIPYISHIEQGEAGDERGDAPFDLRQAGWT